MRSLFRGPGPTALVLIFLYLTTTVLAEPDHHGDHHGDHHDDDHGPKSEQDTKDEDYQKLTDRLDDVTSRLGNIDHHLDKRLSPKIRQRALSLEHRVSEVEEAHCDADHYDCGGQDHQCVSRLKVCDGHKDCRNGDDEKHCTLPTNIGDRFIGYKVYDHCEDRHIDKLTLIITSVKVRPAYPAFPMLKAVLKGVDNDHGSRIEVAFHKVGYYRFNTHKLVLLPAPDEEGGEGRGVVCEFDGHDLDRCVAKVKHQVSLHECAEFIFFRERKRDDHH